LGALVTPSARATLVVALFAAVPAVICGVAVLLAAGPVAGIVVFAVVGAALVGWARFGTDRYVTKHIGGTDADPRHHARLYNLVEGLSVGSGLRQPRLVIVDSPGLNAVSVGTSPTRATVGVTTGLLAELERIELEAVLAEELIQIRRHDTRPMSIVAATFGLGRRWAIPADRDAGADQSAVALTRYPPALASALEKIEAKGAAVPGQPRRFAQLWLADPGDPPVVGRGRLPLHERIEALREL
jgi:heat shock protein HtpX